MIVYKPPQYIPTNVGPRSIFLGGSIDMGSAENWQDDFTKRYKGKFVTIFNPRRDDWDSSWEQNPDFGTKFNEQVTWEMDCLERSKVRVFYFADNSMSPITLLELGRYGSGENTVVRCTPNFYRYGNVKMFCDRYFIRCVQDMEQLTYYVDQKLGN